MLNLFISLLLAQLAVGDLMQDEEAQFAQNGEAFPDVDRR